jgi:hypothetical protein
MLFIYKLDLNLGKKLVKCSVWSIALYGAQIWTLRKVDQKYVGSFEMWCWRSVEVMICTERVKESRRKGTFSLL